MKRDRKGTAAKATPRPNIPEMIASNTKPKVIKTKLLIAYTLIDSCFRY
jgi:hypothetical protein